MKRDEPKKTRTFIKKGLVFWGILIVVFISLKFLINTFGDIEVENSQSGFLKQLSGMIFTFGICGIPIILFFSVVLKFAEKTIDKLVKNKNNQK